MKKKISKEQKEELKKNIPDDIKIIFGKFYLFSFVYIIFFSIIYPFVFIDRVSKISLFLIFIIMILFYIYIILDVLKKKKGFKSYLFDFLIICVILSMSFSIIKFFV